MNERDQIQRDDESNSAAESSRKPAIDQPAEPPGSVLKIQGTKIPSDASTSVLRHEDIEAAVIEGAVRP